MQAEVSQDADDSRANAEACVADPLRNDVIILKGEEGQEHRDKNGVRTIIVTTDDYRDNHHGLEGGEYWGGGEEGGHRHHFCAFSKLTARVSAFREGTVT